MIKLFAVTFVILLSTYHSCFAQTAGVEGAELGSEAVFDDRALINGYTDKFALENKDVLLAMVADDSVGSYKCAAAVRVFKQKYGGEILSEEKSAVVKILLRRLNRTDSPFVQIEIFLALIVFDRYQYFQAMIIPLIQKLDHYNAVVRALAYDDILDIIKDDNRTREARIIFNTLRKMFFLSRNRLKDVQTIDDRLKQKIALLRWAIKVLGTQELKRLPPEIIRLL